MGNIGQSSSLGKYKFSRNFGKIYYFPDSGKNSNYFPKDVKMYDIFSEVGTIEQCFPKFGKIGYFPREIESRERNH